MERDEAQKIAMDVVKAQASVRTMTVEEMMHMVDELTNKLFGQPAVVEPEEYVQLPAVDPKTSIRENTVICVECGEAFKLLTKKHLAKHGLTPESYRSKWGIDKKLVCKSLKRMRRAKISETQIWNAPGSKGNTSMSSPVEVEAPPAPAVEDLSAASTTEQGGQEKKQQEKKQQEKKQQEKKKQEGEGKTPSSGPAENK